MLNATQQQTKNIGASDVFDNQPAHDLLVDLLAIIKMQDYQFTTVTPRTHAIFLSKPNLSPTNLRDIFGWNLPFSLDELPTPVKRIMVAADIIEPCGDMFRSKVRIASLSHDLSHHDIFLHSGFPTTELDSVFFGPDTYRFARFIRQTLTQDRHLISDAKDSRVKPPLRILDIGCGTGAGGVAAIRALPHGQIYEMTMNDISPTALNFTRVNAQVADIPIKQLHGDVFETLEGEFDLIISNPPYMNDESSRAYRDGGAQLGLDLSIRIFTRALQHLAPGGKFLLYTGVAMTDQSDPFLSTLEPLLADTNFTWSYEEIDPDIFGEELQLPSYSSAHRIAAVGLVVTRKSHAP